MREMVTVRVGWRVLVVGALVGPLGVLGACGAGQDGSPAGSGGDADAASPSSSAAIVVSGLEATGWQLAGVPGSGGSESSAWFANGLPNPMVADGDGQVWIVSGWQVTRLDPTTGESETWDVGDDAAFGHVGDDAGGFGPVGLVAPATGSGVWLLDGGRVRLFDGDEFVVDLQVPADVLDVSDAGRRIRGTVEDVVERGSEVWLSIHAVFSSEDYGENMGGRVVRWADGQWSQMSTLADGVSGDLAVDSEGSVWAGGGIAGPQDYEQGVRRWDGSSWTLPGADDAEAPSSAFPPVGMVAADPTGGIWFLAWGDEGRLYHFDGSTWRSWPGPWAGPVAVSADGDAWLAGGGGGVTRFSPDGATEALGSDSSVAGAALDVETPGDTVLIADNKGVLRLDGDTFTRIWRDPVTPFFGSLAAVSQDEVWAFNFEGSQFRYDGEWHRIGMTGEWWGLCGPVLASDGALWVHTKKGLVRQAADENRVVPTDVGECHEMLAGPSGSVWVSDGEKLRRYTADGTATSLALPGYALLECLKAAGPDGSVWTAAATDPDDEEYCGDRFSLARWDGREWLAVDAPPGADYLWGMVLTDDGAAWVASGRTVSRYADGGWQSFDVDLPMGIPEAAPDGRACGMGQADPNSSYGDAIICFDATGEVGRIDITGMGVADFSVAPDGSIWVLGPQVAVLPDKLPRP